MVNKRLHSVILLLVVFSNILFSQQQQITEKQSELSRLRQEIGELEQKFRQMSAKEKESFDAVENFNRQGFLLNKIIGKLRDEEKLKQQEVSKSEKEIKSLSGEIASLKENYSKYIVAVYKHGRMNELSAIFDSESVHQALLRIKYLRRFSQKRQKDLEILEDRVEVLESTKNRLQIEKAEKTRLAEQKKLEERVLTDKLSERKKVLGSLKTNKAALKKEIDAKREAEVRIKAHITKLIEEAERRKREEEERLAREKSLANLEKKTDKTPVKNTPPPVSGDIELSTGSFASFSALKGKMSWPVQSGKILRKFGESKNEKLNTVTLNYGIDIQASGDLNVRSVAEGVISVIDWIPGYGIVVIITHRDEYRTVYSHLSEIFVKEGDRVKPGSVIAKVGESIDGYILHFEIWNSRNNQNPETWLAKK